MCALLGGCCFAIIFFLSVRDIWALIGPGPRLDSFLLSIYLLRISVWVMVNWVRRLG
jgi:hypothetical protein